MQEFITSSTVLIGDACTASCASSAIITNGRKNNFDAYDGYMKSHIHYVCVLMIERQIPGGLPTAIIRPMQSVQYISVADRQENKLSKKALNIFLAGNYMRLG